MALSKKKPRGLQKAAWRVFQTWKTLDQPRSASRPRGLRAETGITVRPYAPVQQFSMKICVLISIEKRISPRERGILPKENAFVKNLI
jgi:hypothetical protein